MRTLDRSRRIGRSWSVAVAIVVAACLFAACGGGAPTPPAVARATPLSTPAPTPLPHMSAPAKADDVYLALRADGLLIVPNTASTGGAGREPVKQIDATYEGWPLAIGQYSSAASLLAATKWVAGEPPGRGEAPIEFLGLNILIRWGPIATAAPAQTLTDRQLAAAVGLRDRLDLLLSPLATRTTVSLAGAAPIGSGVVGPGSSTAASPSP